jgi:hypothetical protein
MASLGGIRVDVTAATSAFQRAMQQCVARLNSVGAAAAHATSDADRFGAALYAAGEKADGFKSAKGFASDIMSGAAIATAALGGLAAISISAASDFNEATNVINTAFGALAPTIETWAKDTAQAMGRSTGSVRNYAGALQALLVPMVGNASEAARMSTEFSKLAIDLASFWNVADDEALVALRAGLAGESEPLKRFGVDISDAALNTLAFSMGLRNNVSEMDKASKTKLVYLQVMKQTAMAQGDAIKTGDGLANSIKALEGAFADLKVALGTGLLPIAAKVTQELTGMLRAFNELSPGTKAFTANVVGIGAAAGATVTALAALAVGGLGVMAAISVITPAVMAAGLALAGTMAAALGTAALAAGVFVVAFKATGAVLDAFNLGMPKGATVLGSFTDALESATTSWEGFKQVIVDGAFAILSSLATPFKMGRSMEDLLGRMHDSVSNWASGTQDASTSTLDLSRAMKAATANGMSFARETSEAMSLIADGAEGMSQLADASLIGSDIQVDGALSAAKAEDRRASAIEKSRKAMEAFRDVQRKASLDAVKGATAPGARGVADIFASLSNDTSTATKAGKRAGVGGSEIEHVVSQLIGGAMGNLREELSRLPLDDFAFGLDAAVAGLERLGKSGPEIEAMLAAVRRKLGPDPNAAGIARADDRTEAEGVAKAFNEAGLSVDEYNREIGKATELIEAFGFSPDELKEKMQARPQDFAGLVSGKVGGFADNLATDLGSKLTPADRSLVVDNLSNAVANSIAGGSLDMDSISRGLGALLGGTAGGSGLINDLFGQKGGSGISGAAGGAALGAMVMPVVGLIAQAGEQAAAAIQGVASSLAGFVSAIAELMGDGRLQGGVDAAGAAFVQMAVPVALLTSALTMIGFAFVAVLAPLYVLAAGIMLFVGLLNMSTATKSFERFQSAVAGVVDRIVLALEPFWEAMLPVVGLFDSLVNVLIPMLGVFGGGEATSRALFAVFKFGAIIFGGLLMAVGVLQLGVLKVVEGIAGSAVALVAGFRQMAGLLGLQDIIPMELITSLDQIGIAARAMAPNLAEMGAALTDITALTYEESKARADELVKRKEASAEMTNVPDGYKVIAARFRSIEAQGLSGGVLGPDFGGGNTSQRSTTINVEQLLIHAENIREMAEQLEKLGERRAMQWQGGTISRDAQNNGR